MKLISIIPITTEKAYGAMLKNVYTFKVPVGASKQLIAENVENQFGVTVTNVTAAVQKGKSIRYSRGRRTRPGETTRTDFKKAYVTLKEGDKIKVFDEEQIDAAQPDETKEVAKNKDVASDVKAETKKAGLLARRRTGNRGDK
ncbi:MAG: 50S ribosomal protein L23 [Candidatus Nomurabacteria bacterium]|jgi:large subunit ribosomal protein L23|nr:50S ribosomal protein L23 [Candidatus Nomurabacteria bacterium]